jgi:cardiolipin synthase
MRAVPIMFAVLITGCGQPSNVMNSDSGLGDGRGHDGAGAGDGGIVTSKNVTVLVEPNGNHMAELVSAISGAHQSVYMTMYQLDNTAVINALVARKQAGLDVQVILDGSTQSRSWNTPAYNQLNTAGVGVVWSNPVFTYTHEKCVIVDSAQAWIMTMNANTSPPSSNREYLAIDTDVADVAEAVAVFKADHAMQAITPSGNLVVANANARQKLVDLIKSATKNVDLEGEEFSDMYSTGITNALAYAATHGIVVRIVIANGTPTTSETQAIAAAKNAGAKVVITGPASSAGSMTNPYIHAKAIVVDCVAGTCARGFVGSENFSGGSLGYNREVGVIFDSAAELAKIETAISTDFSHGTLQ